MFTDDGIHWHIIPLGSVPQFNGHVVSAGKDVWTTRDIAAAAHHAFVCLCKTRLRTLWNTFNHGKLVRSNVLKETSHLPGRQAFPLSQVPHSDLPICRSRAEGGERVGVLGDAGQPVPVPFQAAEERFGKHTLQLYCIQCTLVSSLRLASPQDWGYNIIHMQKMNMRAWVTCNFCWSCGCRAWTPWRNLQDFFSTPWSSWWRSSPHPTRLWNG